MTTVFIEMLKKKEEKKRGKGDKRKGKKRIRYKKRLFREFLRELYLTLVAKGYNAPGTLGKQP